MTAELNVLTPSMIGLELHDRAGEQEWYLISSDDPVGAVREVCDALASADVVYQQLAARTPEALLHSRPPNVTACVPTDTWDWDDAAYAKLDYLRGPIREAWPVLVWVSRPQGVQRLVHLAPNFSAFFQPSVGTWSSGAMEPAAAQAHLAALRERYALSDEDVVSMAQRGELPEDADHQAWLVLLGRGDLIGKTR